MQNSLLWLAFHQKIDDKIKFLHLKKFTIFLRRQIRLLRKPIMVQARQRSKRKFQVTEPLDPNRQDLNMDRFDSEYTAFMKTNEHVTKQVLVNAKPDDEKFTPQEQVQMEQQNMQEAKHFDDFYKKNHVVK